MAIEIRLKQMREAKGISQNALARELGMSLTNIQKIERGAAKSVPLDTLDNFCRVLECKVCDLLVQVDN
ncbi:transcriptional regulator (plasmid) [Calothrix sp. NIES-4071]|nr:transcriptional regulator [Calothrix sp. NIES-4071]BAZ64874.1 transcriptional regulator [Calothrix sp. NIES-4105]